MSDKAEPQSSEPGGNVHGFETTQWSLIEQARGPLTKVSAEALNHLCQAYWQPIYKHALLKGLDHHEASDVAQEVFQKLMRNEFLENIRSQRGRFRTYLLACVDNHLASRWVKTRAAKRGGGAEHVDLQKAEGQTAQGRRPDEEFDYQWMLVLIGEALRRLQLECQAAGKAALYEALKPVLAQEVEAGAASDATKCLGLSDEALRAALHRLRRRYKELFREEVARTLANPFDVDDEIRHLRQIFR